MGGGGGSYIRDDMRTRVELHVESPIGIKEYKVLSFVPHSADRESSAVSEGEARRHPPRREALEHPAGR